MTAPPTAVPSSPNTADGGNALAALFAAAAASSMHRQISTAPTTSSPISTNKKMTSTKTIITRKSTATATTSITDKDANNSAAAAELIASLLNGASKSSPGSSMSFLSTPTAKTKPESLRSPATTPISLATAASSSNHHQTKVATVIPNVVVKDSANGASSSSLSPTTSIATSASTNGTASTATMPDHVVLRNLESWHDEDEEPMDDSCYHELVDSGNPNGWSADEMFKYNEKRHKIMSSYDDKQTLAGNYTTPLSRNKSKTTVRLATQLAKEIEQKVLAEGRVTPESSDDDELFEHVRIKRVQLKQQKQLDQLKNLKAISNNINFTQSSRLLSNNNNSNFNHQNRPTTNHVSCSARKSNKSSSQYSNSSATPATASLSSSPTMNDSNNIIKPVTSSSRNILRTCLI